MPVNSQSILTLAYVELPSCVPETAGYQGPIYADPSRELYRTLGMNIETFATTPAGQQKRSYLTMNPLANTIQSIWASLISFQSLPDVSDLITKYRKDH